ncbi:hypothetical protein [Catalinimonas niigatensis]|uniref:hypothetical protein n=1 Tax=Catalinimonas niigatensis TaxID=1397264 RepID=UPI0026667EF3|nr:hypothetical protein [Catalinimonas niigatensis]WPP48366.1 hypothetical protein PZB72_16965 [Catalinimonas niigatensis]WPP48367.1 hypothetical protein PZB72_16970 [Catalinimonas niigatensis]
MKKYITKFNILTLAILTSVACSMTGCAEDSIDPDTSSMPPKNEIKTPPRKN